MEESSLSDLDSEDELQIDETPPPRRKPAGSGKKKKLSSKYLTLAVPELWNTQQMCPCALSC